VSYERTLLVGGLSPVHDALLAAALRGKGVRANVARTNNDGLRLARGLDRSGRCNPGLRAVGAVLEEAQKSELPAAAFAGRHVWVTSGPCRLSGFSLEDREILSAAGLGALPIVSMEQLGLITGEASPHLEQLERSTSENVLVALAAADALCALERWLNPYVVQPAALDLLLRSARAVVVDALENRSPVLSALRVIRKRARRLRYDFGRITPRVLLVGQPWSTLADCDPRFDLARRLSTRGVEVEVSGACDWLLSRIWEISRVERSSHCPDTERLIALTRSAERISALERTCARALGLATPRLTEPEQLAGLVRSGRHLVVQGNSAQIEARRAVQAARNWSAHEIIVLRPAGCATSSVFADAIADALERKQPKPLFLRFETTGASGGSLDGGVRMAFETAARAAAEEFEDACQSVGLEPRKARLLLASLPAPPIPPQGRRIYACTAAELLLRSGRRRAAGPSTTSRRGFQAFRAGRRGLFRAAARAQSG
jgi:predicted nucleotide-binding protein (sugar kinase/HSP70/actin superfamily)